MGELVVIFLGILAASGIGLLVGYRMGTRRGIDWTLDTICRALCEDEGGEDG